MKTPSYYRHKPHEIERAFLVYVPEAPRISPDSVTDWEALSDDNDSNAGGDASRSSSKQVSAREMKGWREREGGREGGERAEAFAAWLIEKLVVSSSTEIVQQAGSH